VARGYFGRMVGGGEGVRLTPARPVQNLWKAARFDWLAAEAPAEKNLRPVAATPEPLLVLQPSASRMPQLRDTAPLQSRLRSVRQTDAKPPADATSPAPATTITEDQPLRPAPPVRRLQPDPAVAADLIPASPHPTALQELPHTAPIVPEHRHDPLPARTRVAAPAPSNPAPSPKPPFAVQRPQSARPPAAAAPAPPPAPHSRLDPRPAPDPLPRRSASPPEPPPAAETKGVQIGKLEIHVVPPPCR